VTLREKLKELEDHAVSVHNTMFGVEEEYIGPASLIDALMVELMMRREAQEVLLATMNRMAEDNSRLRVGGQVAEMTPEVMIDSLVNRLNGVALVEKTKLLYAHDVLAMVLKDARLTRELLLTGDAVTQAQAFHDTLCWILAHPGRGSRIFGECVQKLCASLAEKGIGVVSTL